MQIRNLNPETRRSHDRRNAVHTAVLIIGTGLLLGLMAYSMFGVPGLVGAAIVGAFGISSVSRVSPKLVLGLYKARPLADHEAPQLTRMVAELARRAGLPSAPKLFYVASPMLNAFAVGSRDDAAIAVTDGLLRSMTLRQMQGVLAHETAHIMNGDLKVMGLADVMNRITSFLSTIGLLGLPLVFGIGIKAPLLALMLMVFAPTIGGLLQLGLSRAREYDADLDGATLTGDPEGLASALRILEQKQGGKWEGMILPGSRLPHPSLLRTHPKTDDRIARLQALKVNRDDQIVVRAGSEPVNTSIVPQISKPQVRWHRMGIYY